uniref:Uncharacterized protein ycf35 n=1 Tax=Dasyclonium flaccidum TaxID=2007274 RepID=A0A1Z1MKG1_9FLOR|nr:hypothetical protein [Dasyclonium flaccidum]ARW66553.1 hypothetical protein [Dasyclonium flaccidum]
MSHFSKIKTNISSLSILKKTIHELGFYYNVVNLPSVNQKKASFSDKSNLDIYSSSTLSGVPLCSFIWNDLEYHLIVDVQLWNLHMDFNYFLDKLSQKYAYNMILCQTNMSGFEKINEKINSDGSIIMTIQRWSSSSC